MRLYELKKIDPVATTHIKDDADFTTIVNYLRGKGFYLAGEGRFGKVFRKDGVEGVIKLFLNSDKNYLKWIEYARAHKSNPYVPQVGKPMRLSDRYSYVRMEDLDTLYEADDDEVYEFISTLLNYIRGYEEVEIEDKNLRDIADFIKTTARDDITTDNVMLRGEQFVITDPFE